MFKRTTKPSKEPETMMHGKTSRMREFARHYWGADGMIHDRLNRAVESAEQKTGWKKSTILTTTIVASGIPAAFYTAAEHYQEPVKASAMFSAMMVRPVLYGIVIGSALENISSLRKSFETNPSNLPAMALRSKQHALDFMDACVSSIRLPQLTIAISQILSYAIGGLGEKALESVPNLVMTAGLFLITSHDLGMHLVNGLIKKVTDAWNDLNR